MLRLFFVLPALCSAWLALAQDNNNNQPQPSSFQPLNSTQSYSLPLPANNNNNQVNYPSSNRNSDSEQKALEFHGYKAPQVPPSDPALRHQYIIKQYSASVTGNPQAAQLNQVLNEEKELAAKRMAANNANPAMAAEQQRKYENAYNSIKKMLDGKAALSVKDAYYQMESAHGNAYMSYDEYNRAIRQSADFIKKWMRENGLNANDNEALNNAIQRFMSDTLTITIQQPDSKEPPRQVSHYPFFYDYNDYKGERDYRNYFCTKTFATGSGQCNSLPAVYLILAEAVGAKAYLTFAPFHSFIKYPAAGGNIKNYEPTSNWNISDTWYQDNLFISSRATQTGIYLDTFNRTQIVANCLVDLAAGNIYQYGTAHDTLLRQCVTSAARFFPKRNNISIYFINSIFLKSKLFAAMQREGIATVAAIPSTSACYPLYLQYLQNEESIQQLGYRDLPPALYTQLMEQHEFKGRQQQQQNINSKQKRNMFFEKK